MVEGKILQIKDTIENKIKYLKSKITKNDEEIYRLFRGIPVWKLINEYTVSLSEMYEGIKLCEGIKIYPQLPKSLNNDTKKRNFLDSGVSLKDE